MIVKTKYIFSLILAVLLAAAFAFPAGRPALAMHDQGGDHQHMHVMVDIKPGSYPNTINQRSQGNVPVALFGSLDFDVSMVDIASVRFGPVHQHDSGAPVANHAFEDINGDGFMDIIFKFKTQATGLTSADVEACLHGMTLGGMHFCGHDSVRVIG